MLAKRAMIGGTPAFAKAKTFVLFGGSSGVGTTTVCHNLACAMGLAGHRVATIDLNPSNPGLAELTGRTPTIGIDELLTGRLDLHEYLVPGLAASLLLPTDQSSATGQWPVAEVDRFIEQLMGLGRHADIVLIDAGNELTPLASELWRMAQLFLVVLNPTADAITAGYERIRSLHGFSPRKVAHVIMNRASSDSGHLELVAGMDSTAGKFLNLAIESAGHVEMASEIGAAFHAAEPFIQRYADHAACKSIQRIADRLVQMSLSLSQSPASRKAI
ncbi:MinD/ParA family ATP-binding protein [Bremerella alba]|nr:cellulose synthase operon protein YhjQ/BcsQ [Bremerella alba]